MEKHSKKLFASIITLMVVILLVTACAPAAPVATSEPGETEVAQTTEEATAAPVETGPKTGGTLTLALTGDFNSWNAWAMLSANDILHNMVYSRLLWKDASGEIHPDLATEWKMADDGLSMTLKIREGVKWHDGKDLTANDFVEMFNYTTDETLSSAHGVGKIKGLLKSIESVVAEDDYTLKLSFPQPIPFIYDILDYWYAILIPDKEDVTLMKSLAVGTGPYKMTEWAPKEFVRLEKFEDYYNKDVAYVDEIVIRRLDQAETLVPNLLSGTVDVLPRISPYSNVDIVKAEADYSVLVNEGSGGIVNVIVNTNLAPLDKKEVRQAISYALNRQLIAEEVYYGISKPTTSPFYSPATIAYREDLVNAHEFNLDKAKELLDQAGVSDLTLTYVTGAGFSDWKIYAQIWQSDLAKIGITLKIDEFEDAKFYEIAQSPDLGGYNLAGWGTGRTKRDPAIFFQTQPQYGAGEKAGMLNPYNWYNAEYEECVAQGRVELDPAKRAALYQRANEILVDELPMIQIVSEPAVAGFSNQVKNLYADLLGFYGFDTLWLDR